MEVQTIRKFRHQARTHLMFCADDNHGFLVGSLALIQRHAGSQSKSALTAI